MERRMLDGDFDAMVEACRTAYDAVVESGAPEMQAFARGLSQAIAEEVARQAAASPRAFSV